MATTLTDANTAAPTARAADQAVLDSQVIATISNHYRGAAATVAWLPPAAEPY